MEKGWRWSEDVLFAAKRAYWLLRCFFWVRKQRQNEHLLWTRISCALSCVEDRGVVPAGQFGPVRVTSRALPGHWKTWRRHCLGPNKLTLKRNASPPPRDFWLGHLHSPNSKLGNDSLILNHRITTNASFESHPPTFTMSLNTGGTPDSEVS